jgi:dihydrolipoamide dehydrogenase
MAEKKIYDITVIGAGPAGYTAAIRAAQLGMSVAVADKNEYPGGTCLNIGCIPSKSLLESSELYYRIKNEFEAYGIIAKTVRLDLKKMLERKQEVVLKLVKGVQTLLKENGVSLLKGSARILPAAGTQPPYSLEITPDAGKKRLVQTGRILIATGSVPVELQSIPFDYKNIVSSTEALSFRAVPRNLVVIGAGAIGLEMGSIWARLGSRVIVIELMPQIVPGWDAQIARQLHRILSRQGMAFKLSARVTGIKKKEGIVAVSYTEGKSGKEATVRADKVLVAAGRKPYYEGLGVEEFSIKTDKKTGFIGVNRNYETDTRDIYAIGDVIGGAMFAHKAGEEGIVCVERMSGIPATVNYTTVPSILYTFPEAGSVGFTEEELTYEGRDFKTGVFRFAANGRAIALGAPDGFVKIIADKETDEVLGVHILGPWASDLIAEAVAVMEFGGGSEDIARIIHAHPSLSEVMKEAALAVDKRSIHALN